jgi:hypothetical protein
MTHIGHRPLDFKSETFQSFLKPAFLPGRRLKYSEVSKQHSKKRGFTSIELPPERGLSDGSIMTNRVTAA